MTTFPTIARFGRALPAIGAASLIAYGLISGAGVLGLLLLGLVASLAAAWVVWARGAGVSVRRVVGHTANGALLCVPALLVLFFSFSAGGFFPDTVAVGALAVATVLVIRLGLAERPLAAIGPQALGPLIGLAGLAGWALVSQLWSHAPGRATIGFDRDLLYLLTFALFASVGRTRTRLASAVRGVALSMVAVAGIALLSRVAPDVLPTAADPQAGGRLAYPLTYWNALGLLCAVASVLSLHLAAADDRRSVRVLAAGALPVIGTTLLLTYSRGALGVAVVGIVVYAVLGRPRGLLSALVAAAPGTAIAMKVAYDSTLLSSLDPTIPAALPEGHHLALVTLACVASAFVLRGALLALDHVLERDRSPIDRHRGALRVTAAGGAVLAVALALALGAPAAISNRWDQFVNQQTVTVGGPVRNRLSSTSNNGRLELWTVAMNAFSAHRIDGTGADTFEIYYYQHRSTDAGAVNATSLYIETLSDLGIVGLFFVALYVLGTLVGLAPFGRGRDRTIYAALFAVVLAWALHAGVDWDWQMPAVSLWVAALGGLALGRPRWRRGRLSVSASVLAFLAGALVLAAAVLPALVLSSQVHLNEAIDAYGKGNCRQARQQAQSSIDALGTRAGPWQIEALCSARAGHYRRAEQELRAGLAQDPSDWQLRAGLAAATAAAGADARGEVAVARRLNPLDPGVLALSRALARGPSARARQAARAYLLDQSLVDSG